MKLAPYAVHAREFRPKVLEVDPRIKAQDLYVCISDFERRLCQEKTSRSKRRSSASLLRIMHRQIARERAER